MLIFALNCALIQRVENMLFGVDAVGFCMPSKPVFNCFHLYLISDILHYILHSSIFFLVVFMDMLDIPR
jgi:hypothetical protein